jgi:Protein of unknown function (DUF3604)
MNLSGGRLLATILLGVLGSTALPPAHAEPPAVKINPQREAYYGDLHLHTSYSFDAYLGGTTQIGPDEAYRFARGQVITYYGQPVQRREPLDFLAVTDHAENMGVLTGLDDPTSPISESLIGRAVAKIMAVMKGSDYPLDMERLASRQDLLDEMNALSQDNAWGRINKLPANLKPVVTAAWEREIEFANRNYEPGRFTTFIAYEWTAAAYGSNLHRNVIFRGSSAPRPFTSFDSRSPEELWEWLDSIRKKGFEALAIPHNGNASNGLMYDWLDSASSAIDRDYALQRQTNEPLSEISQNKGASETHPLLSPNDEFANFEIYDYMESDRHAPGRLQGSYLRDALGRGLLVERQVGVNPFKYGFVGASDHHTGLSVSAQQDYAGSYYAINMGGGRPTQATAASVLQGKERVEPTLETTTGSLTGVWAESNTRDSIYDALRRRETFATSGSRLKFRFFGSWTFDEALLRDTDWVRKAYQLGVPMGGDLPPAPAGARAPTFLIWAARDANGGNLDRIQIVKVWAEGHSQKEKVFDVAWAGNRRPDLNGKLPEVGDTVDLTRGTYSNNIGVAELKAVWRDPGFDPRQYAAYYLRVLEIPTPRWTTLLAVQTSLPLPTGVPTRAQQRGWSSPIWYTPPSR